MTGSSSSLSSSSWSHATARSKTTSWPEESSYDYIVVGGGTAAMGFLYGLLLVVSSSRGNPAEDAPLKVLVLERGGGGTITTTPPMPNKKKHHHKNKEDTTPNQGDNVDSAKNDKSCKKKEGEEPPPQYLRHWYRHATRPEWGWTTLVPARWWWTGTATDSRLDDQTTTRRARSNNSRHLLATDSNDSYSWYAMPTGRNWGGTTTINAGLCCAPPASDFTSTTNDWPRGMLQSLEAITQGLHHHGAIVGGRSHSNHNHDNPNKFLELEFPSHATARHIAKVASPWTGHRLNYYQALVQPLLGKQQQQQPRDSKQEGSITTKTRCSISIEFCQTVLVERILLEDTNDQDDTPKSGSSPSWLPQEQPRRTACGVVIRPQRPGNASWHPSTNRHKTHCVMATRHVILAAGVLESPALLVASGIVPVSCRFGLCDHVVVPMVRLHHPWDHHHQCNNHNNSPPHDQSLNGVAEWFQWEQQQQQEEPPSSWTSDARPASTSSAAPPLAHTWTFQLTRMDSSVYADILPDMAMELVVRCLSSLSSWRSAWPFSSSSFFVGGKLSTLVTWVVRHLGSWCLQPHSPFQWLLDTTGLTVWTVFLLSPHEPRVGSFQVQQHQQDVARANIHKNQPQPHHASSSSDHYTVIRNRSELELDIDLHYLQSLEDVQAYRHAWPVAEQLIQSRSTPSTTTTTAGGTPTTMPQKTTNRIGIGCSESNATNKNNNTGRSIMGGWECFPGAWIRKRLVRFAGWARWVCMPYYHWCGSLTHTTLSIQQEDPQQQQQQQEDKFGTEAATKQHYTMTTTTSLVCPQTLQIQSVAQLSVCDASAFPVLPRAPTALTCAALGHWLARHLWRSSLETGCHSSVSSNG